MYSFSTVYIINPSIVILKFIKFSFIFFSRVKLYLNFYNTTDLETIFNGSEPVRKGPIMYGFKNQSRGCSDAMSSTLVHTMEVQWVQKVIHYIRMYLFRWIWEKKKWI